MGNKLSYLISHGRRLKNRYNAQYRAIEFIGKENRPGAPRHPVNGIGIENDTSLFQELQKKNLKLDEYLRNVYVRSDDKVSEDSWKKKNNPERPLPESREPRPKATFKEPKEVDKGWCTITQISDFIASHEQDPVKNSIADIAKKYDLEERKVENTLKYFTIFRVYDVVRDTLPREDELEEKFAIKNELKELREGQRKTVLEDGTVKQRTTSDSDEQCQPVQKAIKNV